MKSFHRNFSLLSRGSHNNLLIFYIIKAFTSFVGDVPQAAKYWKEDRFCGSQFLNGCNPDSLKRCTKLPPHFPVTQELVGNLLDSGDTLESAMVVGSSILM